MHVRSLLSALLMVAVAQAATPDAEPSQGFPVKLDELSNKVAENAKTMQTTTSEQHPAMSRRTKPFGRRANRRQFMRKQAHSSA